MTIAIATNVLEVRLANSGDRQNPLPLNTLRRSGQPAAAT
jgi:hypothetical protein